MQTSLWPHVGALRLTWYGHAKQAQAIDGIRTRVHVWCCCAGAFCQVFFDADIDFVLVHNSARALICAHICTWQMQRRRFATVVQPQREGVPSTMIQARIILYCVCVDS